MGESVCFWKARDRGCQYQVEREAFLSASVLRICDDKILKSSSNKLNLACILQNAFHAYKQFLDTVKHALEIDKVSNSRIPGTEAQQHAAWLSYSSVVSS